MDKSAALAIIEDMILINGYDKSAVKRDFKFLDDRKKIVTADIVVFGDNYNLDLSTSCISVGWVYDEIGIQRQLDSLKSLATPIVLLLEPKLVRIYDFRESFLPQEQNVTYELLERHFSLNRLNYSQDYLMVAKKSPHFLQLMLFAIEATKEMLVEHFEYSVLSEQRRYNEKNNSNITKVAIHVLAACIIEDKLWNSNIHSQNAYELLYKCVMTFPNYFKGILGNKLNEEIAERIYCNIRSQLTFTTLTSDMLGYFYEYLILDEKLRESLGIYWTDESIAQQICWQLPFELIPVDNRFVLDGTCGSGSLLVAACNRLSNLLPIKMSGHQKHDWLTKKVMGIEIEAFSAEIAKLSLLLYSLPFGNEWNIINVDFFCMQIHPRPFIIVANPPFKENKTDEISLKFINKYFDDLQPGGIMGIVLPETYLESNKCRYSRVKLLKKTRIYEIWHLPEGAFATSSIATTVILLRKLTNEQLIENYAVKIVEVEKHDLHRFKRIGEPSQVYFLECKDWLVDSSSRIVSSLMEPIISTIKFTRRFEDVASLSQGIIPGKYSEFGIEELNSESGRCVKWLQSPGDNILQPYSLSWKDYRNKKRLYTLYPGMQHRPRLNIPFEKPKILINSSRNASGLWRIYATIDYDGYYVSQSFWVLFDLEDTISMEEIVAVINNPLSNVIINKYNRRTFIQKSSIMKIPIPPFNYSQKEKIRDYVKKVMRFKFERPLGWEEIVRNLVLKIDEIVFDAFEIPSTYRSKLTEYMSNDLRPGDEWPKQSKTEKSIQHSNPQITWKITGTVEAIDIKKGLICISVDEFPDTQWIPIPQRIPGWCLESGQSFEADIPFEQRYEEDLNEVNFLKFRLIEYGYLSDGELDNRIDLGRLIHQVRGEF
ncbi:MAG TPA: hypothetical protein DHV24_00030 [Candidatus Margulisbacteria bacterium]|nr:hypothetical protein [Candidatus Margulisiibacteriota bacterium]